MRLLGICAVILMAIGQVNLSSPAQAQTVSAAASSTTTYPSGPYKETCKNLIIKWGALQADCKTFTGGYVNSMISLTGSNGVNGQPVYNCGGILTTSSECVTPPQGSYTKTCTNYYVSGTSLVATCPNQDPMIAGPTQTTSLANYAQYVGRGKDIRDCWGKLSGAACGPKPKDAFGQ